MRRPDRIARAILDRNGLWLGVLVLVLAGLCAGIPGLRFESDSRAFFGADNQENRDMRALDGTFSGSNSVLVMVQPAAGTAFDPETLAALRDFTEEAWQVPYVLRIDSPVNYNHSYAQGDDIIVEPLLNDEGKITQKTAKRFRDTVLGAAELTGRLVARDGGAFGISVRVVLPEPVVSSRLEVRAAISEMAEQWQGRLNGSQVRITGGIFGGLTLVEAAQDDMTTLIPAAFVLVTVFFAFLLRSFVVLATILVAIFMSTLAALGFAGWAGIALTAGTAISPLAVMVLVTASGVHIVLSWLREDGADPVHAALRDNLSPVTVTNLTTAFGFLCINFADSPPLRDMGNIVAFGLLFGLAATFIVIPYGLKFDRSIRARRLPVTPGLMIRLAEIVIRWRRVSLVVFALMVALAITGILRIGFDDSIYRYFDDRYQFRRDADAIQDNLTGLEHLLFSFRTSDGGSVFDPEFLRQVDRFQTWIGAQPEVSTVSSIADLLKRLNKSMHNDDPAQARIADSREANAQLMLFYELSLPVGLDLNNTIDVARTQTLVSAGLSVRHSEATRALALRAETWLAENTPDIATRAAGISIAFARISERNNRQMLVGLAVVLALVSATMVMTLQSLPMGMLSLVPNLVPAVLAFGFWGYTIGEVNLGSTVVCTMTFGIVVDDTVHFLMHYLRRRRAGLGPRPALHDTFSVVGAAIVITSIAIMGGFALMTLSGFVINQHIGALTFFVMGFALLADLILLPAMLVTFKGSKK